MVFVGCRCEGYVYGYGLELVGMGMYVAVTGYNGQKVSSALQAGGQGFESPQLQLFRCERKPSVFCQWAFSFPT